MDDILRPVMEAFLRRADVILVGARGVAEGSKYLGPYLDKCHVVPFAVSESILRDGREYIDEYGCSRNNKGDADSVCGAACIL